MNAFEPTVTTGRAGRLRSRAAQGDERQQRAPHRRVIASRPAALRSALIARARRSGRQERRHERVGGRGGEGRERALLDDASGAHEDDQVGELRRFADVVGDDHDGLAERAEDGAQVVAQLGAHQRIQRAERLVEQQHLGVEEQRAHDRDALDLPARQLGRVAGEAVRGEAGQGPELVQAAGDAGGVPAAGGGPSASRSPRR